VVADCDLVSSRKIAVELVDEGLGTSSAAEELEYVEVE